MGKIALLNTKFLAAAYEKDFLQQELIEIREPIFLRSSRSQVQLP